MRLRKILLKLQVIFMYVAIIPFVVCFFILRFGNPTQVTVYGFLAAVILGFVFYGLTLPLAIANGIVGLIGLGKDTTSPFKITKKTKLICIPWFIGNYFAAVVTSAPLLNPFLMLLAPIVLLVFCFFGYSFGVSVNAYDFAYVIRERKKGRMKKSGWLIFLIILLFIPVIDVLAAVILDLIEPKYKVIEEEKESLEM